jgi:hypothetical protein
MIRTNDYIPVRSRLFIRRAMDVDGVKRCMVVGVLVDDMGLEMDEECIIDAAVQLTVLGEKSTGRMFRGHRLDQVLTSAVFGLPLDEIKPAAQFAEDAG